MATKAPTDTAKPRTTRARKPAAAKVTARRAPEPAPSGFGTGVVVAAAAAGVAVGLLANLGRKAIVQAPSALAGDWFELVKVEHKMALTLFDALEKTDDSSTVKRSILLTQLGHALAKHALTEENAIYPTLRDMGEKEEADKLNHEHGYVKQYLHDLHAIPNDSPAFLNKLREFRAEIEHHMREEENEIFPPLHQRLGEEKNKALTLAANKEGLKLA